jgi:hypothetical protein
MVASDGVDGNGGAQIRAMAKWAVANAHRIAAVTEQTYGAVNSLEIRGSLRDGSVCISATTFKHLHACFDYWRGGFANGAGESLFANRICFKTTMACSLAKRFCNLQKSFAN